VKTPLTGILDKIHNLIITFPLIPILVLLGTDYERAPEMILRKIQTKNNLPLHVIYFKNFLMHIVSGSQVIPSPREQFSFS